MASSTTNKFKAEAFKKSVDFANDVIKIIPLKSSYTPNPDHKFISDIVASECDATGYVGGFAGAGRKVLASKTVTQNDTADRGEFDAADTTLTAIGGATNNTIGWLAVVREVTNDADSPVYAILDPADVTTNGTDITYIYSAQGLINIT